MGESTATTVEFLRARLLAERSASRAAREKADELAARVAELEEQLTVAVARRERAEKAAKEMVVFLTSRGFAGFAEMIGFGFEVSDGAAGDGDGGGEEERFDAAAMAGAPNGSKSDLTSTDSKTSLSDQYEDDRGSSTGSAGADDRGSCNGTGEVEGATTEGKEGNLRWKGRSGSGDLREMQKVLRFRERFRRSISSMPEELDPTPKYQIGKSCRKSKHADLNGTPPLIAKSSQTLSVSGSEPENVNHSRPDDENAVGMEAGGEENVGGAAEEKAMDSPVVATEIYL